MVISLVKDVLLLLGIIYAMLLLSPSLTLVSFTVIPVMAFLVLFIKNRIKRTSSI